MLAWYPLRALVQLDHARVIWVAAAHFLAHPRGVCRPGAVRVEQPRWPAGALPGSAGTSLAQAFDLILQDVQVIIDGARLRACSSTWRACWTLPWAASIVCARSACVLNERTWSFSGSSTFGMTMSSRERSRLRVVFSPYSRISPSSSVLGPGNGFGGG